jgi:hypothetical protein
LTSSAPAPKPLGSGDPRYQLNALGCPHPQARERALVQVYNPDGEAMDLCVPCKLMFDEIRTRWTAGEIRPAEIRTRMRRRGYDDADARQFINDLQEAA